MKTTALFLSAILGTGTLLAGEPIPAQPAAIQKWQDARFGMFIHWGPVSLTGKEIGWSRGKETPVEQLSLIHI